MGASASLHEATVVLDDRPVLRSVSLDLGAGLTLVRGANGAGKTTLLRAFAGLVPLAKGARAVPGPPLYIGHRPMLMRGLTATANLAFFASFRGRPKTDVAGVLRRWGLGETMRQPVERLSAGQRKRAALARLESEPEPLVLLDEPFADLDTDGVLLVRAAIASALVRGQIILLATHFHEELDRDATARFVLVGGELRR